MTLEANSSALGTILFKDRKKGYSLRINALMGILDKHNLSLEDLAFMMDIPSKQLELKLKNKQKLDKKRILKLISIIGERDTFYVIYFNSFSKRREVYKELYGKEMQLKSKDKEEKWKVQFLK